MKDITVKEAASDMHQKLVKALIDQFEKDGLKVENAAYEGYPEPYKIGKHEPDIIARSPQDIVSIGEAKTCDDLTSDRSKEQFVDFSKQSMNGGKSNGATVPFHIITSKTCNADLHAVLKNLRLEGKANINIWTFE